MKKILLLAATVATAAMTMVSCNGGSGSAKLENDVDSLTYELGVAQAEGLKQYMAMKQYIPMQLDVDTAYMDEFIKGIKEGATNELDPKKDAYMKGLKIGREIQQMAKGLGSEVFGDDSTQTIDVNKLLAGIIDGLENKANMTPEEASADFESKMQAIKMANLEKKFGANKKAGEKYLAENKKKDGVTVTESGLQYRVLVEGDGELPTDTTQVTCNYKGSLIDGTVFDSSEERGEPLVVNMRYPMVIPGWAEALKLMPAGSKWEVTIPYELAYGVQGSGPIEPFSTLIFEIEVLK